MLQIKNLNITHKKDLREIVTEFSLVLNDGDKAAIIGEEGNGKSTILKLIYDEMLVDDYAEYTGEIIKNNVVIGYLAQELPEEEQEKGVYEYLSSEPTFFDMDFKELSVIATELGISTDFIYSEQKIKYLSGGEKVKIQFVRMMSKRPNVYLLDEPSNDIDIQTLEWLEDFINQCSYPVLYISHDETLLERTANTIIHLEQIRRKTVSKYTVVKSGYSEYVGNRQHGLEKQEQNARKERSEYAKTQEKFRKIQQTVESQQNSISRQDPHTARLLKKKMHAVKSMERRFEKDFENMTEMPDTEEAIFFRFEDGGGIPNGKRVIELDLDELVIGDRILAENISLHIVGPQKVCIIGKNGIGKTTLLKQLTDELLQRKDIAATYMPQNYEELLDLNMTPIEYLTITGEKEEQTRIRTYLGSMKYTADEMNHAISELSGGQKAKVLLLKMSMNGSNVLILDEPTRNFSPLSNPIIRELLTEYKGAIISISHDRKYINEVCDKVYELTNKGLKIISNVL